MKPNLQAKIVIWESLIRNLENLRSNYLDEAGLCRDYDIKKDFYLAKASSLFRKITKMKVALNKLEIESKQPSYPPFRISGADYRSQ
jgi:hypothetical protein